MVLVKICVLVVLLAFGFHVNVHGRTLNKDERDLLITMLEEKLLEEVKQNDIQARDADKCSGNLCIMNEAAVRKECLAAHNKVRAYHDAKPLTWDKTPANEATPSEWAEKLAGSRMFMHDPNTKWGENIAMYGYMTDKPTLPCAEAVYMWYGEVKDYRGPYSSGMTGHFTQLVWKATTKVNCGVAYTTGSSKAWYTVCRYSIPGNMMGEFEENVSAKDLNLMNQLKSGADLV